MTSEARSRSVIVAIDDHDESRDALRLGQMLVDALHARMVLATMLEPMPLEVGFDYERLAAEVCDQRFERASRRLGHEDFEQRTLSGRSAPRALTELAEDVQPDVMVFGSTHHGRVGRVVPGGTAYRFAIGAPCAVAVAPKGFAAAAAPSLARVGVGYTPTEESAAALAMARDLAASPESRIELIAVEHPQDVLPASPSPVGHPAHELAHQQLRDALESAAAETDASVACTTTLLEGNPADVLEARSEDLDLLVLGSRSYGPVHRVLLGGASGHLLREAHCPLLIVPRARIEHAGRPPSLSSTLA